MSALKSILNTYRTISQSERDKGTYFEHLTKAYFENEPQYADLFEKVWMFGDWAEENGLSKKDTGIDLVARTNTGELYAIQCKLYAEDYHLAKSDIDSFFTASGKKEFSHRIIISTTYNWTKNAIDAIENQNPPVIKIDLVALENSLIDWTKYQPTLPTVTLKEKKKLRPHQTEAVQKTKSGLATADRGKLIMACGTGKTFTSLKIAEQMVGAGGKVLFLVPSLSLLSQTLTEWTQESETPIHSFAVCSDSDIGKKKVTNEDAVQLKLSELKFPATTNPKSLANNIAKNSDSSHMTVVFSTYHSIEVIGESQQDFDLSEFDLIICDEAHRTTGAIFESQEESAFVRVHDNSFIKAKKRLYMTATPRIFADTAKAKAETDSVQLCSMDDPALYGETLHTITFSQAVKLDLLVDYKVIVLTVEEAHIQRTLLTLLDSADNDLKVDDAAKIVGCWKALAKIGLAEDLAVDPNPMKRAVAFAQVIEPNHKGKGHKVSSKNIAGMFQSVVEEYQKFEGIEESTQMICQARHVDGGMGASAKEERLSWLKEETEENTCRILSNVRCLSEGVDVPALDAVLFLTPRNSQVDVVQSVGRVMRKYPGKKRGYVILPVVIPAGIDPKDSLDNNDTYKVVWQVLQALRSHDDRFDAMINKMDLELNKSLTSKMEVIAIADSFGKKATPKSAQEKSFQSARKSSSVGKYTPDGDFAPLDLEAEKTDQQALEFEFGEIERAIYAKVVKKCGNRHHWEDWANDIAKIARTHIDRITAIIEDESHTAERKAFFDFADELRDDLNDSISNNEVIEMLAQHLITKPVFDALFEGYSFASNNPVSTAMQSVLELLQEHNIDKEADTLEHFYASVRERASGIESAAGKQKIVVELYDKFFRNAFPKMTERLGIVYTPVEVVDFIIHSINHLLKTEFNQSLGSKGVHIIDPFTGTGTFVTRLLQSGLIAKEELAHKYANEIHANELVLLAYYIAAINIEAVYHSIMGGEYKPFEGICLTDTFQLYEKEDLISAMLEDNSARRKRQKSLDIRVIMGNPPYSAGQNSANDNNANVAYPSLDSRIAETYAEKSKATNKNALYDSYIRAVRWASDRIGKSGIVGFVSNGGFVDSNSADGLRKCLAEEFSSIYIFHLRGNARTSGELRRKEKGNVFGEGTRTPVVISFLVKNPEAKEQGKIHFCDIGDYLSREEKLAKITDFMSIEGITNADQWQTIIPDEHGDWINQRDDSFGEHIAVGDKNKVESKTVFENYSCGVKTQRDVWCYNPSKNAVASNMQEMISFYNSEVIRFEPIRLTTEKSSLDAVVDGFINTDPSRISWSANLIKDVSVGRVHSFEKEALTQGLYRPFSKQWLYYNRRFNERVYQMPRIFPNSSAENLTICVTGNGAKTFTCLISNVTPDIQLHFNGQCFPLYLYEEPKAPDTTPSIFDSEPTQTGPVRRDAITDAGLAHFQEAYPQETITKEDLFYYIYGLLHSEDYRSRYADNLSKELPRIPRVKKAEDFWEFSKAGRKLADLHLNYETVAKYPVKITGDIGTRSLEQHYRVEKMKYKSKDDKSTLIYNSFITLSGIPLEAYDYVVNGKPALDWVVERQCVKTDKKSGIVNDANLWATETMKCPSYPLDLFQRVITVSIETMKIVHSLPSLDI